jgi:hypothetical protein
MWRASPHPRGCIPTLPSCMRVGVGKRSKYARVRVARMMAVAAVTLTTGARAPGGTALRPLAVGSRSACDVTLEEETDGRARPHRLRTVAASTRLSVAGGALREVARARTDDTPERHDAPLRWVPAGGVPGSPWQVGALAGSAAAGGADGARLASGTFASSESLARGVGATRAVVARELGVEDGAGARRALRLREIRTLRSRGAGARHATRERDSRGGTP